VGSNLSAGSPLIRRQPVFKFTHRSKTSIFTPQGRLVARIHVKFDTREGTWVRLCLAVQNFTPIAAQGWERGPQNGKNFPLFGKESPRRGKPFDRFLQLLGTFIGPTILHQIFTFDAIRFTGYGVITEKLRVGHLSRIFPVTLYEKLCVGSKND